MSIPTGKSGKRSRQSDTHDHDTEETILFDHRGYYRAVFLFLAKVIKDFPRRASFTITVTHRAGRMEGDDPGGATE